MLRILRFRPIINTFRKGCVNEMTKYCSIGNYSSIPCRNMITIQKSEIYSLSVRYKHKKTKQEELTDTDEEITEDWDEISDKQNKLLNVKVNSLRADVLVKAGLGIARNKIETMFYESRIRINGQKLMKKSQMLSVGDEIDVIKGNSVTNPNFLTVARVEVLSATEKGEGFTVKLRRNKSLIIENYESEHAWKG